MVLLLSDLLKFIINIALKPEAPLPPDTASLFGRTGTQKPAPVHRQEPVLVISWGQQRPPQAAEGHARVRTHAPQTHMFKAELVPVSRWTSVTGRSRTCPAGFKPAPHAETSEVRATLIGPHNSGCKCRNNLKRRIKLAFLPRTQRRRVRPTCFRSSCSRSAKWRPSTWAGAQTPCGGPCGGPERGLRAVFSG